MAHKNRAEQYNERTENRRDDQVKHKERRPRVYRRTKEEVEQYIEELNEGWEHGAS